MAQDLDKTTLLGESRFFEWSWFIAERKPLDEPFYSLNVIDTVLDELQGQVRPRNFLSVALWLWSQTRRVDKGSEERHFLVHIDEKIVHVPHVSVRPVKSIGGFPLSVQLLPIYFTFELKPM